LLDNLKTSVDILKAVEEEEEGEKKEKQNE
jgi:hypothetical protein